MTLAFYGDPVSHMSRACLLYCKDQNIKIEEHVVKIFKGEHKGKAELPFGTIPALHVDGGKLILSQSTTILRYLAAQHGDPSTYNDPSIRFLVDDFFDFFQSTLNPAMMKFVLNKNMYKVFMKKDAPDQAAIDDAIKGLQGVFEKMNPHFFKGKQFIAGDKRTIADILCLCSFDQLKYLGYDQEEIDGLFGDYIKRVSSGLDQYEELTNDVKGLRQLLADSGMM